MSGAVKGARELQAALERYGEQLATKALPAALYKEGFRVLGLAIPLAPLRDGHLRRSGYVAPPERVGATGVQVKVGFGTVYARRQHFELSWRHPRGGQALYLSTAIAQRKPAMAAAIAKDIIDAIRGGSVGAPIGRMPPRAPRIRGKSIQAHNRALYAKLHPKRGKGGRRGGGKR